MLYFEDPDLYEGTELRWHRQGLPEGRPFYEVLGHDNIEWYYHIDMDFLPKFEVRILEETGDYRLAVDERGITTKTIKNMPPPAMPQWLDFPVKNREDFRKIKPLLDPTTPGRYPANWDDEVVRLKRRDHPVGLHCKGLFMPTRDLMGFENLCMAFYDDPVLIHEIMDHLADFYSAIITKALAEVEFDYAYFCEDLAYKTASMISPKHFNEFMAPNYRKMVDLLHARDIDIIMVDSDGHVDEIIPLWLDLGISGVYPMEVAAGMDVVALRKEYGKDLIMMGGIDKREIARSEKAIDEEMARHVEPILGEGGYIPKLDHAIPPDISWTNMCYYHEKKREISRRVFGRA